MLHYYATQENQGVEAHMVGVSSIHPPHWQCREPLFPSVLPTGREIQALQPKGGETQTPMHVPDAPLLNSAPGEPLQSTGCENEPFPNAGAWWRCIS
jgi:hypothetical protein